MVITPFLQKLRPLHPKLNLRLTGRRTLPPWRVFPAEGHIPTFSTCSRLFLFPALFSIPKLWSKQKGYIMHDRSRFTMWDDFDRASCLRFKFGVRSWSSCEGPKPSWCAHLGRPPILAGDVWFNCLLFYWRNNDTYYNTSRPEEEGVDQEQEKGKEIECLQATAEKFQCERDTLTILRLWFLASNTQRVLYTPSWLIVLYSPGKQRRMTLHPWARDSTPINRMGKREIADIRSRFLAMLSSDLPPTINLTL